VRLAISSFTSAAFMFLVCNISRGSVLVVLYILRGAACIAVIDT